MKYHQKLNLKSPIFKYNNTTTSRTPSKSPIKPSVNPTDLFQKVCCPNCKYAFKIIRHEVMKQNPPEKLTTPTKKNKTRLYKEIQTQTEGILTLSNNNSPSKSILSQNKFSKTDDFSAGQNSKGYEWSQLNEALQQQDIENRQLKQSDFKFKPLSLSPHSKFSKSKNLLKTLDSKGFQIQDSQPMSKSPAKTVQHINPYYVQRPQSPMRKEENIYQQTLPFREEDKLYNENTWERKYSNGGNIEREPIGYGNSNARGGQGDLVSPHASSGKLEEINLKSVGMGKLDSIGTPKSNYDRNVDESTLKLHQNMRRGTTQNQQRANQMKQMSSTNQLNNTNQMNQNSQINQMNGKCNHCRQRQRQQQDKPHHYAPAQSVPSKKDSAQFQQLIRGIVVKNQQQQQVIKELQEICRMVSDQVELPSFCKMLAFIE